MRTLFPLLAVALLAGCALQAPAAPGSPGRSAPSTDACGALGAGEQDAPLVPAFAQAPLAMAKRLAAALDDPLASEAPELVDGERWTRWRTQHGSVAVELAADGSDALNLLWESRGAVAALTPEEANATLARVLDAFGIDRAGLAGRYDASGGSGFHVALDQRYRGAFVEGESASYTVGPIHMLSLSAFHAIAPGAAPRDDAELVQAARAYARCALDAQGRTEAKGYALLDTDPDALRWSARNGTLARVVSVEARDMEGLHCGIAMHVRVAAREGAPLGLLPVYCD